jgi:hypothetical protein
MFMLPGQVYGDLTLIKLAEKDRSHYQWLCSCTCGNTKIIREVNIKRGASTSCGLCNYPLKHPLAHKSWDSMKQRCTNSKAPDYPRYGARGITICRSWDRFINFLSDMGDPPTCAITGKRFSLERIDVNGNYTKDNCCWAHYKDQNANKTNSLHPAIALMKIKTDYYRKKK